MSPADIADQHRKYNKIISGYQRNQWELKSKKIFPTDIADGRRKYNK